MQAVKRLSLSTKEETSYCVDLSVRDWQIKVNSRKVKGRVTAEDPKPDSIAIVGFGPSLAKTYKQLKKFKNIITASGAHKFLLDKGFKPEDFDRWLHLDVDPRAHKVELLGPPRKGIEYVPASCLHPTYIDLLLKNDCDVKLWHVFAKDGESEQVIPPGELQITGGSDAGMRCMSVARVLGYKDFHIFGLDGSDGKTGRHASKHPNQSKGYSEIELNGKTFRTTPALKQCGVQVFHELEQLSDVTFKFYGDGLIQEIAKDFKREVREIEPYIAIVRPELISDEMREQNRLLHDENANYGNGGSKYADMVMKMKTEEINSVLDYGAGKQSLAKALPFPIWSFDPAIPEIATPPRPADLVICTDVLEHVEPDKLKFVLGDLQRVTLKVGYFVISTREASKTYPDGRNAHLLVKEPDWWIKKLKQHFKVAQATVAGSELHVIVGPRTDELECEIIGIKFNDKKVRFYVPNDTTRWRAETLLSKEPATIEWLNKMQPGEVLYDIGANVGSYTCYAGVRGINVFAFEPEAENYYWLTQNIRLNGIEARAFCTALSDVTGLSELHLSQRNAGGSCHSFGESKDFNGKEKQFPFSQGCVGMRLDDVSLPTPDHIKIDVDGFEHFVVKGGIKTISRARSVLIELNPNIPEHVALREKMVELGFTYSESQIEQAERKEGPFKGVAETIFYKESAVEKHLADAIRNAELINEPYPHLYIENAFPQGYYDSILDGEIEYKPIAEVRNTGYPERFVGMREFPEMLTGSLKRAIEEKFNVKGTKEETLLIRDLPGYQISPHTDLSARVVSAIFYLAKDQEHEELGTTVYIPKKEGFTSDGSRHLPFKDFKAVKTLPYRPNSAFIFQRTPNSFHGVEKTDTERNVLLYDIRI